MPDKKREVFENEYKHALQKFKDEKQAFFVNHPELKLKPKKASVERRTKASVERKPKKEKVNKFITPFLQYRILLQQGNPVAFTVAQKMWRDLPREEKGKYISEVANMDTEQEKKISKDEFKILDSFNGMPTKPLTAHNIFVKQLKTTYKGDSNQFIAFAAKEWKKIDEDHKKRLEQESEDQASIWREKMKDYIMKFPLEQRMVMFAKFKISQTPKSSRKRNAEEHNGNATKDKIKREKITSRIEPLTFESDDSDIKNSSRKKKKVMTTDSEAENSQQKPVEPPKAKKKKEVKEPLYPSQSTAHYFMTQVYEGKLSKIAKAYKKLDPKEKEKYRNKVKQQQTAFLVEVGKYVKSLSGDRETMEAFTRKTQALKKKQKDELSWHVSTGTDNERTTSESSDSSSDSDSS